ncbi:S1C family serine protease [Acidothermus cellulolyticus]|nr:trypsin-like peptidase domain-containing protein [Acidothermus cellulolyticus]
MGRAVGWLAAVLAAVVVSAGTTGVVVHSLDRGTASAGTTAAAAAAPQAAPASSIQSALAKILPSVVLINDTVTTGPGGGGGFGGFGGFMASGAGTGIIISSDGLVVTNAHVVNGATQINVTLPGNGGTHAASIVGIDTTKDLAVLKVSGVSGLVPATFANSSTVHVGDTVLAIGNALGYGGQPTVTEGIISATNRSLRDSSENLTGLLQTDAAINPGNSGGPLVNTSGEVIGINVAVATGTPSEPAQNIGFAIPSNTVTAALPALEAGKSASGSPSPSQTTAFLGVVVTDAPNGAAVVEVQPSGPAAQAGVQAGDVITAVGNEQTPDAAALQAAIRAKKPGTTVTLHIIRGAQQLTIPVTLGSTQVTS